MLSGKEVKQYYYAEIEKLSKRFAVIWLCEIFGLSRSGYYKWLQRKGQENRYQKTQRILDEHIAALHKAHPSSGYRALNARLRTETGWVVCDLCVLRSMQRLSIRAKVRKNRACARAGLEHTKFPNILARQFSAERPFCKVVTDITHFSYKKRNYAFVCFLDLFNNEILEWNVHTDESMDLIIPPLRRLLKTKQMSTELPMLLHSDQGSQYSSAGFCALLKKYNVTQSMSRAGTPRDNAVMESVFGWFKDFLKADFFPYSSEPIEVVLAKAVHEFNFHRPSHKLHYKSPVQFKLEQGFL